MKIGLVLSGGAAKGAYHAGFMQAIEETIGRENICCVSSTSIGTLNSYMFCKDKTKELVDFWKEISFDSASRTLKELWFKKFLDQIVEKVVRPEDLLSLPMYSPIVYLPTFTMRYNKLVGEYKPKWKKFLKGAVSYPIFAGPFRTFNYQLAIDGGAVDNIPIYPCLNPTKPEEKPDVILALHILSHYKVRKEFVNTGVPIIEYDVTLGSKNRKKFFDFRKDTLIERLEHGYEYGLKICNSVFSDIEDLERIVAQADIIREEEKQERAQAKDSDAWIQVLNNVFYPIVKGCRKKIIDLSK